MKRWSFIMQIRMQQMENLQNSLYLPKANKHKISDKIVKSQC